MSRVSREDLIKSNKAGNALLLKDFPGNKAIHIKSGASYDIVCFGLNEKDLHPTVTYTDGELIWHRPFEAFIQKFRAAAPESNNAGKVSK